MCAVRPDVDGRRFVYPLRTASRGVPPLPQLRREYALLPGTTGAARPAHTHDPEMPQRASRGILAKQKGTNHRGTENTEGKKHREDRKACSETALSRYSHFPFSLSFFPLSSLCLCGSFLNQPKECSRPAALPAVGSFAAIHPPAASRLPVREARGTPYRRPQLMRRRPARPFQCGPRTSTKPQRCRDLPQKRGGGLDDQARPPRRRAAGGEDGEIGLLAGL